MAPKAPNARKRTRTFEDDAAGPVDEDGSVSKGGHSLRKRARVDYTALENDDDAGSSAPETRTRKRKPAADVQDNGPADLIAPGAKRQRVTQGWRRHSCRTASSAAAR